MTKTKFTNQYLQKMLTKIVRLNIHQIFILLAFITLITTVVFSTPSVKIYGFAANWQKGASISARSTEDYASDSFKQSLKNLANTGANFVSFVIPYYQSNIYSNDLQAGNNTSSDLALISGISYAKSLGMEVGIKIFAESKDGQWRALIKPSDANGWFTNYGTILNKYAQISKDNQVSLFCIGTEMVGLTGAANTQSWVTLINNLKSINSTTKYTYGAQWGGYADEKNTVQFWPQLDYIGLSAYFALSSYQTNDPSVDFFKSAWDKINNEQIKPLQQKYNKNVLFTEVGYKSVTGAYVDPGDWNTGGGYNGTEQAREYDALFSYFNSVPYIRGIHLWDWNSDPNYGGNGNIDYTPQGKPAQDVMTSWFKNNSSPVPPSFSVSSSTEPSSVIVNQASTITVTVKNTTPSGVSTLVDVEIYNDQSQQVYQKFYDNQTFTTGESKNYALAWTPNSTSQYTVKIGVFSPGWTQNYLWNASVQTFQVSNPPANNTTPTGGNSNSYSTDIWWPSNGSSVSGVVPFKAIVPNLDVSQYSMYWQVDGGSLNGMYSSNQDYPHKEALVDLNGWDWKGSGPYVITFVSKDLAGNIISKASTSITVTH